MQMTFAAGFPSLRFRPSERGLEREGDLASSFDVEIRLPEDGAVDGPDLSRSSPAAEEEDDEDDLLDWNESD